MSAPGAVLHVITRLTLGGSARNTIDSAAATARAGYRTVIATGPSGDEIDIVRSAEGSGCRIVVLPSLQRSVSPIRDLRALWETYALIRRENVRILHTHTSKAGFIGRLAGALAGVPSIVHSPHGHIFYGYYGGAATSLFTWLERIAARLTDRMVVLTDRGADEHLARGIGRPDQYVTIPSGVDTERLAARAPERATARGRLGIPPDDPVLVGIGRLVPIKGFDLAVRALATVRARHGRAWLILVGDGPERASLTELAERLGVRDALDITGARDDVAPYLAAADVLVAPSRNEGMGRVLVEAMALGVPVVATRVGGIPSVVSHLDSGLLVEPGDRDGIADAVCRLVEDDALRERFAASARARAEQFSLRVM